VFPVPVNEQANWQKCCGLSHGLHHFPPADKGLEPRRSRLKEKTEERAEKKKPEEKILHYPTLQNTNGRHQAKHTGEVNEEGPEGLNQSRPA
tara:strand:+ start:261 stop:536 length:276 start_codon:yes stop_codon:yes gene_type:complete